MPIIEYTDTLTDEQRAVIARAEISLLPSQRLHRLRGTWRQLFSLLRPVG